MMLSNNRPGVKNIYKLEETLTKTSLLYFLTFLLHQKSKIYTTFAVQS